MTADRLLGILFSFSSSQRATTSFIEVIPSSSTSKTMRITFIDVQHRNKIVIHEDKTDVASAERDVKLFILEFDNSFLYFDTAGLEYPSLPSYSEVWIFHCREVPTMARTPHPQWKGYAIQCFRNIGL